MAAFVQSSSLPKLKCYKCKRYLSYFPILTNPECGSLCGRCNSNDTEDHFRNDLYETLAEHQKFPCIFQADGCIQNLFPSEIPQHEKYCKFKKHECPTRTYNNCEWEGLEEDLLSHFENEHPTFVLRDGRFEIDFVNNHTENYLLSCDENLFVLTRTADSLANTYCCRVCYVGGDPHIETYYCILNLESGNHQQKSTWTFQMNDDLRLNGDNIRSVLNDPISIIGHIEIKEPATTTNIDRANSESGSDESMEKGNFELLVDLECPVCFEYLVPPVLQCIRGHSICQDCKDSVSECPTCKGGFENTQNFSLEKVISTFSYPCKFQKCNFKGKVRDIKQHESTCIYGPLKCPLHEYIECCKLMSIMDMYEHVANNHYENLLEFDILSIPFYMGSNHEDIFYECYIIKHAFQLFRLCFKYEENTFFWAMQLIGSIEDASKYRFEIDIIDNNGGSKNRMYYKGPCTPFYNKEQTFGVNNRSCVYFKFDQISNLMSYELTYRVRIISD